MDMSTMGNRSSHTSPLMEKFTAEQLRRLESLKNQGGFNVECLVFEGGGAKAAAYIGAVQNPLDHSALQAGVVAKCIQVLEELAILPDVYRFAGTSGGALLTALLAIRLPVEEIRIILESQSEDWVKDAWGGYLSLIPNLMWKFGWNRSQKIEDIFNDIISRRFTAELEAKRKATGLKNVYVTFMDIYKKFGTELCLVSTNVSTRSIQYHHTKTTPNESVVEAIRASMSLPLYCQPVNYQSSLLVDGGLLCNFPLHVFDGWYLSMKPEDSFFHKAGLAMSKTAFLDYNEKTVGFILSSMGERDVFTEMVDTAGLKGIDMSNVNFPDTKLTRLRKGKIDEYIHSKENEVQLTLAAKHFLDVFKDSDVCDDNKISRDEFRTAYLKNPLSKEEEELLFGEGHTVESIFSELDSIADNELTFSEFLCAMNERGVMFRSQMDTYFPSDVSSIWQFISSLYNTLSGFTQMVYLKDRDVERTVNIETWYVQTMDLELEPDDKHFLAQQGVNACLKYLEKRLAQKSSK